MSVNVPRLNSVNVTTGGPTNDRIRGQVQDNANVIAQQTGALSHNVDRAAEAFQRYEDQKIEQLNNENEQEYSQFISGKLQELKNYEGDPTDAYAQFENEEKEKFQEIMSRRSDVSERVKRHMTSKFDKVREQQRIGVLKQRGAQQETYKHNLFESTVKLKNNQLTDSAGYIRKGDPGSYLPFDQNISDITTLVAKRGMEKGTVERLPDDAKSWSHIYQDEDGNMVKVKMSNMAKVRVAKELSTGVSNSINAMLAAGNTEEAKEMNDRYKSYLDPVNRAKIDKKFKDADVKDVAFGKIAKIETLPEEDQLAAIEKEKNPEIKAELLKIKDANDRRRESIRDRKEKANYETIANKALEKMNSDQPYYGIADLENDPVYKQVADNLNPKDKKALFEMVETPKESNDSSVAKVQDLFFGNDENFQIETITPTEFNKYLSGLSKSDRKKFQGMYTNMRTETAGEQRAHFKRAESLLTDQLVASDYIRKNQFGKFSRKNEKKLIEARDELIKYLDEQQGTFSDAQTLDFVKKFTAAKIEDEVFVPPERRVFNKNKDSGIANVEEGLSQSQKLKARKAFKKEFERWPNADDMKSKQYKNIVGEIR